MSVYATLIGTIAGICLGYAILYAFIGARRQEGKRLNLTFALFAFGYAGTLLMGIWFRSQTTASTYLAISRWDSIFVWLAFVGLNWYVAEYTAVKSKIYLWGITAVLTITSIAAVLTPTLTFAQMPTLEQLPLPWDGTVNNLVGEENIWGTLFFLSLLITLGYIIYAGIRQWRQGERQPALFLLAGMSWFIAGLFYEILAESGAWVYIPFAETGFLGIAIALSLQMANSVIKTEEALAENQQNLQSLVEQRTIELEVVQEQLIEQAQDTAVSEERSRIARDLHDSVTQTIYSATLIAEVLPQVYARDSEEGARNLGKLRQLVRGALAEMRTLLFELRPSALAQADLETLLPQLTDAFTGRTRIPVDVVINGRKQLPPDVKKAIYRITQEALNNISKHAGATKVFLILTQETDIVQLTIRDNGRGFDVNTVPSDRMGIAIMQERAAAIQADLNLVSQQGNGTKLELHWSSTKNSSKGEQK